jgi:hypothetical protein
MLDRYGLIVDSIFGSVVLRFLLNFRRRELAFPEIFPEGVSEGRHLLESRHVLEGLLMLHHIGFWNLVEVDRVALEGPSRAYVRGGVGPAVWRALVALVKISIGKSYRLAYWVGPREHCLGRVGLGRVEGVSGGVGLLVGAGPCRSGGHVADAVLM